MLQISQEDKKGPTIEEGQNKTKDGLNLFPGGELGQLFTVPVRHAHEGDNKEDGTKKEPTDLNDPETQRGLGGPDGLSDGGKELGTVDEDRENTDGDEGHLDNTVFFFRAKSSGAKSCSFKTMGRGSG